MRVTTAILALRLQKVTTKKVILEIGGSVFRKKKGTFVPETVQDT